MNVSAILFGNLHDCIYVSCTFLCLAGLQWSKQNLFNHCTVPRVTDTNYRGPSVRSPKMLRTFLSSSVVSLFVDGTNQSFQTKPKSLWSFRFVVRVLSRSPPPCWGGGAKHFLSLGPKPALDGPISEIKKNIPVVHIFFCIFGRVPRYNLCMTENSHYFIGLCFHPADPSGRAV